MNLFGIWALRLLGITGILGSILFIFGDLLYNHVPGSKDSPAVKMSKLPEARLLNAGVLGLIGCWFYTLASLHLYIAFRPVGELFAVLLFLAFAATMICYGLSHTAYFAIASGARIATTLGADAESGGKLGSVFFKRPANPSRIFWRYSALTGKEARWPPWKWIWPWGSSGSWAGLTASIPRGCFISATPR